MANQIRMSPDTMRIRATAYGKEAEEVTGVITRMDNLLKQLETEWEGEASKGYSDKYGQLRPSFVKMSDLIGEIKTALETTAKLVEETDANIAAQFRA